MKSVAGPLHLEFGISSSTGPVECLGMTFENDEKRRDYFREQLRKKLKDPEFRSIEGFPIGEDEDILAVSDPPYYTACPNPFIEDFLKANCTPYDPNSSYRKEPFASDVLEGKNDPIYNAHSYHTKVPHKAIMRYILHYTEPGDVVFDGFCGSGMTGVAAQLCDDPNALEALGYTLRSDDDIFDATGRCIGRKGIRKAVLNDLSPAATLIAAGYNLTRHPESFAEHATELLSNFGNEYGWMYQTIDSDSGDICDIDYTVWSEVFSCPHCFDELEFWALAYDSSTGKILDNFVCPQCSAEISKRDLDYRTTLYYDKVVGSTRAKTDLPTS